MLFDETNGPANGEEVRVSVDLASHRSHSPEAAGWTGRATQGLQLRDMALPSRVALGKSCKLSV